LKNILTNPEDMADFIKIVSGQLQVLKQQRQQTEQQLEQINGQFNEATNTIELLKDWQQIMTGDDLTLIKMAYADIKKNMTDLTPVEDTDETK